MKKFFSILFLAIFCSFSIFSLSGCRKNEIDKVSKNLTAYSISASLDDENKKIHSIETIVFYNNTGKELEYVCLHLYPRAFREGATIKPYTSLTQATCFPVGINFGDIVIISVKVNSQKKEAELIGEDEDILKINFGFKLTQKKSVQIEIEFDLIIPNSTHRLGWFENNINLGNWYPIICKFSGEDFEMSPYYSTGDPFYSDISNYSVEFSYPSKYELASTGNINLSEIKGIKLAKISAKAVRDFAMCLSSGGNVIKKKSGKTEVTYLSDPEEENSSKYLDLAISAVNYFSNTFGVYPYSTLSVVKTPFIYGGMEYPNIVFISNSIDDEEEYKKVIVHEIAHQWWYGVVGNNEIKEAWLDESLSEYSTALFFEHNPEFGLNYDDFVCEALSSYMLYVDVIGTLRGDVNTKMNLAVNQYQNDYEYSYMVYVKGVIMFDSLKNMVGEKSVISGLKRYYQSNKFKIATSEDFLRAFEEACHKDLNNFFDGFLNGTTIISTLWHFCFKITKLYAKMLLAKRCIMRIVNLSSGSKANSTFVGFNDTKILIDAGLNEKKLCESLLEIGENIENIKSVFVTHEHIDHIRAIKNLAKKTEIDFYFHQELIDSGALKDFKFKEGKLHSFTNDIINIGDLQIQPFDISHDAVHPVGFVVNVFGSTSKVGFVTDLGIVTDTVKRALVKSKIVFIESNYDEQMLLGGTYPFLLKRRILGEKGHLSNAQSLELAKYLFDNGTKCFVLSHISENNNTYELALANFVDYFANNNVKLNQDVIVKVSFQMKHGNNYVLKEEYNGK